MTSRFILTVLFVSTLPLSSAWAGPVTLDARQVEPLRQLVAQDAEAAGIYVGMHKAADQALNDTPQPVAVIVSEGKLDSDPDKIASNAALKDFTKMEQLAWVGLIDKNDTYTAKGIEYIMAWAKVNHPDGDPINETRLEALITAYDIMRPRFAPGDRSFVDNWLENRAVMLWNDPRHHEGNWQSHRLKIVGLIATVLNDDPLWQKVEAGFKEQMGNSFSAGGESMDFVLRDAMHYHIYSVVPLLTLACVAHQRTHDWYDYQSTSGASLKQAVDFVKPYASGQKQHIEFANSKVKFDKARADAGQKEYIPHPWSICEDGSIFPQAACVDPDSESWALKTWCSGTPHQRFVNWQSVLNFVRR